MPINRKYSRKHFSDQTLLAVDPGELNNTEIVGSTFYQQAGPETPVFPADMVGVVFVDCNLDNCLIPPGNTVGQGCANRRIREQNDREDWEVDEQDRPLRPVNREMLEHDGLNSDPAKIPEKRITRDEWRALYSITAEGS